MKQSTFVAALKFAMHAAAKKDIRYYLNGVLFEFVNDGLILVGTDGHRMAYVILEGVTDAIPTKFIVENTDVKLLLSALPGESTGYVDFQFVNGGLTVIAADGRAMPCRCAEGTYPDWRRVARLESKPVATETIEFNGDYMASAAKACAALGGTRFPAVRMTMHGPHNAAIVAPAELPEGVTTANVVVMPTRT
jgi:DNA polymerase III sliding clamp (beta) subunit (PCNA family)